MNSDDITKSGQVPVSKKTARSKPAEARVGTKIGKYRIVGVLGRGGMGVVYEGEDTLIGRHVAIKVLPGRMAEDPTALARFLSEARAAGRIEHTNVVGLLEVDHRDGEYLIVMQLVRGGSAQDFLKVHKRFNWPEATRVIADACRGLAAAHAAGLIHRDIKPANIMRSKDGDVKLADFGLAKPAQSTEQSLTSPGAVVGTPDYMSPEQCRGESLDTRTDIYSLGATYYAFLTGGAPFDKPEVLQLFFAHCSDPIPDPRAVDAEIPHACSAVIAKAMAKDPADRYATAAEMLAALEAILNQPRAKTESSTEWRQFQQAIDSGRTRKLPIAAAKAPQSRSPVVAAIMGVIIVGVLGGWWFLKGRSEAAPVRKINLKPGEEEVVDPTPTPDPSVAHPDLPVIPDPDPPVTKTDLPKTDLPKTDLPKTDLPKTDLPKTDEVDLQRLRDEFSGLLDRAALARDTASRGIHREAWRGLTEFAARLKAMPSPQVRDLAASAAGAAERARVPWLLSRFDVTMHPNREVATGLALNPKSPDMVISHGDGLSTMRWSTRETILWPIRTGPIIPLTALSPAGGRIAVFGSTGNLTVRVIDAPEPQSAKPFVELNGLGGLATCAAFAPDGQRLAAASFNPARPNAPTRLIIWELKADGKHIELTDNTARIVGMTFSPDGKRLYFGGADGNILALDTVGNTDNKALGVHAKLAFGPIVSRDGTRLATAASDGTVSIREAAEGLGAITFQAHAPGAIEMVFSPDGSRLATFGAADGTLVLWDAATGRRLVEPTKAAEPGSPSVRLMLSDDGRILFTHPSASTKVAVWDVDFHPDRMRPAPGSPKMRTVWAEDFETTPVGTAPLGGWFYTYNGTDRRTTRVVPADAQRAVASGRQAMTLFGDPRYTNAAVMHFPLPAKPPFHIQTWFRFGPEKIEGGHGERVRVNLRNGTDWGATVRYLCSVSEKGIDAGRPLLANTWYKLFVSYRPTPDGKQVTVDYWIDDELQRTETLPWQDIKFFELNSCSGTAWFDDIKFLVDDN